MKKLFATLLLIIFVKQVCFAHKEWVHQYIVREAYSFLRASVGEVNILRDHVGFTERGDFPWTTGKIVAGAYREDLEDPVFRYSVHPIGGPLISITHFWDADAGDGSRMPLPYAPGTLDTYENAYQKALHYVSPIDFGYWTAEVPWPYGTATFPKTSGGSITIIHLGRIGFSYDRLIDFYKNKKIKIVSYLNTLGQMVTPEMDSRLPVEVFVGDITRDYITWEVLGRIAHLLGDMSVPAHVHNDAHGRSMIQMGMNNLWVEMI